MAARRVAGSTRGPSQTRMWVPGVSVTAAVTEPHDGHALLETFYTALNLLDLLCKSHSEAHKDAMKEMKCLRAEHKITDADALIIRSSKVKVRKNIERNLSAVKRLENCGGSPGAAGRSRFPDLDGRCRCGPTGYAVDWPNRFSAGRSCALEGTRPVQNPLVEGHDGKFGGALGKRRRVGSSRHRNESPVERPRQRGC